LPGKSTEYEARQGFKALIDGLYRKEWIVYSKKTIRRTGKVPDYQCCYTFSTAISNERIKDVKDGRVAFSYRDRRDGNVKKEATLPADEFIRRFLAHVLSNSYMRIRHYGFLSNRNRKVNIARVKNILGGTLVIPVKKPAKVAIFLYRRSSFWHIFYSKYLYTFYIEETLVFNPIYEA